MSIRMSVLWFSAAITNAISASSLFTASKDSMQKSALIRSQKDTSISADGEIVQSGEVAAVSESAATRDDARVLEIGPQGLGTTVSIQGHDHPAVLARKSQPESMPIVDVNATATDASDAKDHRRRRRRRRSNTPPPGSNAPPPVNAPPPRPDDNENGENDGDDDSEDHDSAPSPAADGAEDDGDDAPPPQPVHEEPTNGSAFIPPSPSPWYPAPTPPPAPMSMEDLLGPHPSPSPFPPQPDDPAICKDVHDVRVRDTRDHPNWAGVSVVRHGEERTCSNAMYMGTFPNGRLTACAAIVASNDSCSNVFVMHKDDYDCSCVTSWEICNETSHNATCRYELNPGEFNDTEVGEAADVGDVDSAHAAHGAAHGDERHGHHHHRGHQRHGHHL